MLEVSNLGVTYGRAQAVRGISFKVAAGEIACLIGSNGAGKSSSLKAIMGVLGATGRIGLDGRDMTALSAKDRVAAGLALVPEGRHVFPQMTVRENLLIGYRGRDPKQSDERMASMLEAFPILSQRLNQLAGTMSGGEQQMLAIGRALMSGPNTLLLDEPTLGLAPVVIDKVAEVLVSLRGRGLAILLAEQNLRMALGIADRGYVMETGAVVQEGRAADLMNDPKVVSAYLGAD